MDDALRAKRFNGRLTKGCLQCVRGEKLVLYATGICPRHCFFCPVAENKKDTDVRYANERPFDKVGELVDEATMMDAKGAGITGGDPLARIDRTCQYIKTLKKKFGKEFHTHLYTSLNLISKQNLDTLEKAGLDELRLHPDYTDDKLWHKILLTKGRRFLVGVEVPIVPGTFKENVRLIEYFRDKVSFFNLNELEISEINYVHYQKKNLHSKDNLSYAVEGSEAIALRLLKKYPKLNIHYCTASFKDRTQLGRRIKRRAKRAQRDFDIQTEEGMFIRGAIYTKKSTDNELKSIVALLQKTYEVPKNLLAIDLRRKRILTSVQVAEELAPFLKKKGCRVAIVEEYPTWDQLQVSVEFL